MIHDFFRLNDSIREEITSATEVNGVKIKQELIEKKFPKSLTETVDRKQYTNDEGQETTTVTGLWKTAEDRISRLPAKRTNSRNPKPRNSIRSNVQGKRRLPVAKLQKSSKKYFQDIRAYAQTVQFPKLQGHKDESYVEVDNEVQEQSGSQASTKIPTGGENRRYHGNDNERGPIMQNKQITRIEPNKRKRLNTMKARKSFHRVKKVQW